MARSRRPEPFVGVGRGRPAPIEPRALGVVKRPAGARNPTFGRQSPPPPPLPLPPPPPHEPWGDPFIIDSLPLPQEPSMPGGGGGPPAPGAPPVPVVSVVPVDPVDPAAPVIPVVPVIPGVASASGT